MAHVTILVSMFLAVCIVCTYYPYMIYFLFNMRFLCTTYINFVFEIYPYFLLHLQFQYVMQVILIYFLFISLRYRAHDHVSSTGWGSCLLPPPLPEYISILTCIFRRCVYSFQEMQADLSSRMLIKKKIVTFFSENTQEVPVFFS